MRLIALLLIAWALSTPRGLILHQGRVVRFPTYAACSEIADWLNAQAGVTWHVCIRWH